MEVKKISEGMTAPQVAQAIDDNFKGLNEEKADKVEMDENLSELGSEVYESQNYATQYTDSQESENKSFDFPINGYVLKSGEFRKDGGGHCTEKIYLMPNLKSIKYKGILDSTALLVAFYNKNHELIPSISVVGDGSNYERVIEINENYSEAEYFIISSYGSYERYVNVSYNTLSRNNIVENIKDTKSKLSLTEQYYIDINGIINKTGSGRSTSKLIVRSLPNKIDYSLGLDTSGYIIAFFDKNNIIIPQISIEGNTSASIQSGTIELDNSLYENAEYVVFSTYTGNLSDSYVIEDSSESYEQIENIAKYSVIEVFKSSNERDESQSYQFENNGCILSKNGAVLSSEGYRTNPISIEGVTNIYVRQRGLDYSGSAIAFFDKKNNYLKEISISGAEGEYISLDITLSIASRASYFIVSTYQKPNSVCTVSYISFPKPFLYGKNFCALGDSITDGDGNASYSWYDMLIRRYNSLNNSLNFGISGSCLRAMADFCTAENMANIDICFVMGGTNHLSKYRLGTINDEATPDKWEKNKTYNVGDKITGGTRQTSGTSNWSYLYWYECIGEGTSGETDYADWFPTETDATFTDGTVTWKCIGNPSWYSDMKRICAKVWGYNPKIQIIWMIPIKRKSDVGKTPENYTHAEKFNAIRSFCEFNSIRTIDLQKEFPLNEWTKDVIMADNLHPNDIGYKLIQDIICSHIE